jgi:hypothetical protein
MSFFTWCGAAIGCSLSHYFVRLDVLSIDMKRPFFNFIKPIFANEILSSALHTFAFTLSGALLGLLTEMTYNVSFPSLVVFLLSVLIKNRNKFIPSFSRSESARESEGTGESANVIENTFCGVSGACARERKCGACAMGEDEADAGAGAGGTTAGVVSSENANTTFKENNALLPSTHKPSTDELDFDADSIESDKESSIKDAIDKNVFIQTQSEGEGEAHKGTGGTERDSSVESREAPLTRNLLRRRQ